MNGDTLPLSTLQTKCIKSHCPHHSYKIMYRGTTPSSPDYKINVSRGTTPYLPPLQHMYRHARCYKLNVERGITAPPPPSPQPVTKNVSRGPITTPLVTKCMYREALPHLCYKLIVSKCITPLQRKCFNRNGPHPWYKMHVSNVIRTYISNLVWTMRFWNNTDHARPKEKGK